MSCFFLPIIAINVLLALAFWLSGLLQAPSSINLAMSTPLILESVVFFIQAEARLFASSI